VLEKDIPSFWSLFVAVTIAIQLHRQEGKYRREYFQLFPMRKSRPRHICQEDIIEKFFKRLFQRKISDNLE
jgi:hypothetical protein